MSKLIQKTNFRKLENKTIKSFFSFFLKVFLVLIIFLKFATIDTNASSIECVGKKWYDLYKCQVEKVCLEQEYSKNAEKVVKLDKFYEENISYEKVKYWFLNVEKWEQKSIPNIKKAKYLYRENQNKIYKCGIINSQIDAFKNIEEFVKKTDKTSIIKQKTIKKAKTKIDKLKKIYNKKCEIVTEPTAMKKIILDQSSTELCRYMYYLWYLDARNKGSLWIPTWSGSKNKEKSIPISAIWEKVSITQKEIVDEMSHSLKLYPLAFDSYVQYDSFFRLHIMLELLKEDYIVFRDKLNNALYPINQVIYKIINAQSF